MILLRNSRYVVNLCSSLWHMVMQWNGTPGSGDIWHEVLNATEDLNNQWHYIKIITSVKHCHLLMPNDAYICQWIVINGLGNGLVPHRHQSTTQTNDDILWIWPLGTNFSEILIKIYTSSFKKMHLKMTSANVSHFVQASMCQMDL